MDYKFPDKNFFTVSFNQIAHDFAMLKLEHKTKEGKIETYGGFMKTYVEELDAMKCYLKGIYDDDIFIK